MHARSHAEITAAHTQAAATSSVGTEQLQQLRTLGAHQPRISSPQEAARSGDSRLIIQTTVLPTSMQKKYTLHVCQAIRTKLPFGHLFRVDGTTVGSRNAGNNLINLPTLPRLSLCVFFYFFFFLPSSGQHLLLWLTCKKCLREANRPQPRSGTDHPSSRMSYGSTRVSPVRTLSPSA